MRSPHTSLLLGLVALSGCPKSSPQPDASPTNRTNPKVLWLAPANMTETSVKLVDTEPPPF